jgi:hypothetical protein
MVPYLLKTDLRWDLICIATAVVPQAGHLILGRVEGDVSIFDRPGDVTVDLTRLA